MKTRTAKISVSKIVERAGRENITGTLRPGVYVHVVQHDVANRKPNPARHRMLFESRKGRRRLFHTGDPSHPKRDGKIIPRAADIPPRYYHLLDWYGQKYPKDNQQEWLSGIREMFGAGKEIFGGIDADEYVRSLREGWE